MCHGILYLIINFPDRTRGSSGNAQYASARTLRVVTMVTVTRLAWLDSARVAAVVVVARLARCAVEVVARLARCAVEVVARLARCSGRCSWRLAIIYIYLFVPYPKY